MPDPMVNKYTAAYKDILQKNPGAADCQNSLAMCFLKLGLYDKALDAFEKAIEHDFENSETFFYAAVCLLDGKKAYLTQRPVIDKIEKYIKIALTKEPRGIYYFLQAYIKYDYYERKSYNTSPTYQEALASAKKAGFSQFDNELLFRTLNIECPEVLNIFKSRAGSLSLYLLMNIKEHSDI